MDYKHELIKTNTDIGVMFSHNDSPVSNVVSNHWHNHLEIIYLLDGELEVNINKYKYLLKKDDLIVINPKDIHSTINRYGNSALLLQIPCEFLKKSYTDTEEDIRFECNPYVKEKHQSQKNIKTLLNSLFDIYNKKTLGYKLKITSIIYDLLFILVNQFSIELPKYKLKKTERYLNRLESVIDYIKKNYTQCISLEDVSKHIGLNSDYFSRFFKKYMGITFLKYLNSVRLEHFYSDLVNTDSNISDLIIKNGFVNYKLFMKTFKSTYGCTPRELRTRLTNPK
ncbi:AraC family transcriptional regulator [Clostridium oryzae]|uniref:Melibiose operon regulatory protein n=1 Tax=Clostridium oryzae TaxID=1450648 RepID=A0A1V4ITZ2_9CLOT|nr:AraC family transcriptional regulator [Clostridium oryzae]OPJ63363.1 melibiose operon regulatory protein [Clostridium oryzae]